MSFIGRNLYNQFKIKSSFYQVCARYSKITLADNGSTVVAFHPEEKYPYELTKPLPKEPLVEDKSVLKMNDASEVMKVFRDVNPEAARENLMKLTLTTKHRWFPKNRLAKVKRTPPEKPFL